MFATDKLFFKWVRFPIQRSILLTGIQHHSAVNVTIILGTCPVIDTNSF
jgi:hypothetical protein